MFHDIDAATFTAASGRIGLWRKIYYKPKEYSKDD
ncbi:MAG: hypothetical protein QG559_1581 [Campylobacterota bacterium]|jgi:hypothetical protein|nr:hypothetical protein [Campylobacterota bacterium]